MKIAKHKMGKDQILFPLSLAMYIDVSYSKTYIDIAEVLSTRYQHDRSPVIRLLPDIRVLLATLEIDKHT